MKKLLSCILCFTLLAGCSGKTVSSDSVYPETVQAGNITLNTTPLETDGYIFLADTKPAFIELTLEESLRIFNEKGTGVILYSYESCPFCNRAVPIANTAAKKEGVKIYYVNVYGPDIEELAKKDVNLYYEAIQNLGHALQLPFAYDDSAKRDMPNLYVPELVGVKDGEITGSHVALAKGFTLDTNRPNDYQLTDEQESEIEDDYISIIRKTLK